MTDKIKSLRKISDKLRCAELYETKKIIQKLQKFDACSIRDIKLLSNLFQTDCEIKYASSHTLFNMRVYHVIQQIVLLLELTSSVLASMINTLIQMMTVLENEMVTQNHNLSSNNMYQLYLKQLNNYAVTCKQNKLSIINGANAILIIDGCAFKEYINCYDLTNDGLFLTGTNALTMNNSVVTRTIVNEASVLMNAVIQEVTAMINKFRKYELTYKNLLCNSQNKLNTLSQCKLSSYMNDAHDIIAC